MELKLALFTNVNMAVSSLKWILFLLLLITYISNTYGRGGRGGGRGGRGGGGRGGGGYGRSSGSRGGSYSGSSISRSGSSSGFGGSGSSSSKVSSSSSGVKSVVSSGSYNRRYHGSGSRNNNRGYYGSGSRYNDEDKAYPEYTAEPFRFPTLKRVTTIKPYNPFDNPKYKNYKVEIPKLQAPGSGFSRRRVSEEDKIYNDFWAKVPDFRIDDKTIKGQDFLLKPLPKEWWRAEKIPRGPNTRYKRSSDM